MSDRARVQLRGDVGEARRSTPKATGSCLQMIVMPMAASMPLMTAEGTSAPKRPRRRMPSGCSTPASITAVRNGAMPPSCVTSTSTMEVRPAAGPVTDSGERLIQGTTIPPAIPAIRPETGGTPHAMAMPRQRGKATRKTTMPATESSFG